MSCRLTAPVPLPSVFNTANATPGSPALQVCVAGRGPWISRTLYAVLGCPIAKVMFAVTVFEPPVPIVT